jgi:uncharacterized lipoprotein YbaY
MGRPRTVTGAVRFLEPFAGGEAVVHVKVEDVSRADAAAAPIGESVFPLHQSLPAGGRVPFSVAVPDVVDTAHYVVRAHVDCTGSGEVTAGDRISTVAYPVLTHGNPDRVEVEVRKI